MISRNAQPSGHKPPRPAIELQPVWPTEYRTSVDVLGDVIQRSEEVAEGNRIWEITRQTAEGTNAPVPMRQLPNPTDD